MGIVMEINKILTIAGCAIVIIGLALPIAAQTEIGSTPEPSGEGRGGCLIQSQANAFDRTFQCSRKEFKVAGSAWFLRCSCNNVEARPLTDAISRERNSFPCRSRYGFATMERTVVELLPGNRGNVFMECQGEFKPDHKPLYLGAPGS